MKGSTAKVDMNIFGILLMFFAVFLIVKFSGVEMLVPPVYNPWNWRVGLGGGAPPQMEEEDKDDHRQHPNMGGRPAFHRPSF